MSAAFSHIGIDKRRLLVVQYPRKMRPAGRMSAGSAAIFHPLPYKYGKAQIRERRAVPLERILNALFDLQKFDPDPDLASVIDAVHARTRARQLTDDESALVTAAGTPGAEREQNKAAPDGKNDLP